MDSTKLRAKLSGLNNSLDDLEAKLAPLLSQPLSETLVGLEPIQQAKLQVAIPYVVYDLIFIYLKTRGIDPKTHPVIAELDRVRQYFDKIKNAEDPEKRQFTVDKSAANRFIKNAIAQVKYSRPPGQDEGASSSKEGNTSVPVKMTSKMIARAQYEKELKEQESEEEEDLEVFEDNDVNEAMDEDTPPPTAINKGKGKAKAEDIETPTRDSEVGRKRRRDVIDPFDGYGDEPPAKSVKDIAEAFLADALGDVSSGRSTPLSSSTDTLGKSKREKNAAKKAKKKAKRANSARIS